MKTNSSTYFSICTGNACVPGFVLDSGITVVDQKQSQFPCLQGAYKLTGQETVVKYHMKLLQESNPVGRSAMVSRGRDI